MYFALNWYMKFALNWGTKFALNWHSSVKWQRNFQIGLYQKQEMSIQDRDSQNSPVFTQKPPGLKIVPSVS